MSGLNKIFSETPSGMNQEQNAVFDQFKTARTTSRDARFPSSNQAGHCWNRYNEWLLCLKQTGDGAGCKPLRMQATNICPTIWTEKWDEEREEGTFAGLQVEK